MTLVGFNHITIYNALDVIHNALLCRQFSLNDFQSLFFSFHILALTFAQIAFFSSSFFPFSGSSGLIMSSLYIERSNWLIIFCSSVRTSSSFGSYEIISKRSIISIWISVSSTIYLNEPTYLSCSKIKFSIDKVSKICWVVWQIIFLKQFYKIWKIDVHC